MTQIGSNNLLDIPFDLNYGPDNYLWVSEKVSGKVVRINPATALRDELIDIPDAFSTGGQDGLLGFAFDPNFLTGNPYVYLSYSTGTNKSDLKQKIVRYTYNVSGNNGELNFPVVLIENLPASNDHNSGRLIFGSDNKLYYTIGDQANKDCATNLAQFLPNQQEVDSKDWSKYPGKVLRLNIDGSIPNDNPVFEGVRSHIYTYGHRNPQGIVLGSNGKLYSSEHGPSSDDEVNIIDSGKNYGLPYVAGLKDDLQDGAICDPGNETAFVAPNYQDPLMSLFTPDSFKDPLCTDAWMCRLNIAPSSIAIYESDAISTWKNSLLLTSLKRGRVYRLKLNSDGTTVEGNDITQVFYTQNRYRDIVVSPDGKSIYIITDSSGKTSDESSMNVLTTLNNPGSILKFTYQDPLSIENNKIANPFKVLPNPVKNILVIELNMNNSKTFKGELINSMGQVVKEFNNLQSGINETKLNDFSAGVYVLKLSSKGQSWQKRVVLY
ncbi:PQQ-dependent sugar dehydrogenase [Thalassobellus suaedae]|uniref:PQQ-dependent sugar dehydrogenase n=1 Tax=Thalassobellus suaedae TaxID=3074124 RepID=A0ABY9XTG6_9FLAO|nr:PQQ-dependent sugar dehydrogenase [Flavobacteriaceae bacterium HL-DH14]